MRMRSRFFIILASLSTSDLPVSAQQIQVSKENKTIAITTGDQADALADMAVVTVGFQLFGRDQDATYADASKTSNAIVAALTAAGVPKEAIASTRQAMAPIDPGNDDQKARYAQGIRFVFAQSWTVTVPANVVATVLHVAITTGANDSGNIQWQLQRDDALEAEAAKKALEHARQIASQMAEGLGVKLGALVYASNQSPQRFGIYGGTGQMAIDTSNATLGKASRSVAPLAISPERITKSATVYAVFAIE
jgi:uncharacterized protein YggE